ncbi:MAG: hypothetical protein ACRDGH_11415 [Candidatus Limnocylindria bacterium]
MPEIVDPAEAEFKRLEDRTRVLLEELRLTPTGRLGGPSGGVFGRHVPKQLAAWRVRGSGTG